MKISRRNFIKAGVAGATALGLSSPAASRKWLQSASADDHPDEKEGFTYHPPNCGGRCAFKCTVRDGKLSLIEPNVWPDERFSTICLKGISEIERVYSPDRIQTPLKRVGKRGEGKFVSISWDEALTTIADNMKDLIDKYGAESILVSKSYGVEHSYEFLYNLLGLSYVAWTGIDTGIANGFEECVGGQAYGRMTAEITDWVNSSTIIMIANNLLETTITDSKFFYNAQDAGAKIICIDPNLSTTASKADQWIPIKPGTDHALLLGMISIILDNEWYDANYLVENTTIPFLVREDNGKFLRSDPEGPSDVEKNPPLVWDKKSDSAKPFNEKDVKPSLEGEFTVDGIKVKTAFTILKENQKQYTLSWASEKTEIEDDVIYELTKEYATRGPAVLCWGYGSPLDKLGISDIVGHAGALLGALTGNIGRIGGAVGNVSHHHSSWGAELNSWEYPEGPKGIPLDPMVMPISDLREKENPIKAVINIGNTFQQHFANLVKTEEWIDQLDFVVTIDPFHCTSVDYADIVLPASTSFESEYDIMNMQINRSHVLLAEKQLEPLFESKSDFQIEKELLAQFGLDKYHPETPEQWIEKKLESDDPALEGITLETLKENHFIMRVNAPDEPYRAHMDQKYDTPTTKIELYHEQMVEDNQAFPNYDPPLEIHDEELLKKYPLQFSQAHSRYHVHSQFTNVEWLNELEGGPRLEINPKDAKDRSLKTGDTVEVFNDRGSFQAKCFLTESQRPGQVRMHEGWWTEHMIDGNLQNLTNNNVVKRQYKLRYGSVVAYDDTLVEVKKI